MSDKFTDKDWVADAGTWRDPEGWRITQACAAQLMSSDRSRLMRLIALGGAIFTAAYGPLPGLSPPQPNKVVPVLNESWPKPKAKAAPPDDLLYRFFATVTTPGCCPKCSAPCPCAYHSDAVAVR